MHSIHRTLATLCLCACLLSGIAAADDASVEDCTGFRFNLDHELKLFATQPRKIDASSSVQKMPEASADALYAVDLQAQADMQFAAEPGKITIDDGSYAGLLSYAPTHDGTLRITINEAAWVDVVANGTAIQSGSHTGSAGCRLLHKSVQFAVKKGAPVVVQISGSTIREVRMTITQP